MKKSILSKEGVSFLSSFKMCLGFLEAGGVLTTNSGHKIVMVENGQPGFLCSVIKKGEPEELKVMQIGSEVAWMYIVEHASKMTDIDIVHLMAERFDLNEAKRRTTE